MARRRFVWIQGAEEPLAGAVFSALFRRNSDCRLFIHKGLDTRVPGSQWVSSQFIDTGLNVRTTTCTAPEDYGTARIFQVKSKTDWLVMTSVASPAGGVSFPLAGVIVKWASSTGQGEFTTTEDIVSRLFFTRINSGGWGQYDETVQDGESLIRTRYVFDESGILSSAPVYSNFNAYYLPTIQLPDPYEMSLGLAANYILSTNVEKTISIFRAWDGIANNFYVGRNGGFAPLQWGVDTTPVDLSGVNVWIVGNRVYTRTSTFGTVQGTVYTLDGHTLTFLEQVPMRYPSGISGWQILNITLDPF
jgi:hypothetical protein